MIGRSKSLFAVLLLASLACSIPFVGQNIVSGSGDLVTIEGAASGFSKLEIHHSFEVDIIQSQTFSLIVQVDDNIEQYLIVDQRGDTLTLDLEEGHTYNDVTLEATISMPLLNAIEVSGASRVKFAQFESTEPFDITASGASSIDGDIEAGDIDIRLSGASDLRMEGEGQDLTLEASGSSQVDLEDFTVVNASIDLSGASEVIVSVEGVLDVNASGASEVTYLGSPELGDIETSGASSIHGGERQELQDE